jgi:hypothetical protein
MALVTTSCFLATIFGILARRRKSRRPTLFYLFLLLLALICLLVLAFTAYRRSLDPASTDSAWAELGGTDRLKLQNAVRRATFIATLGLTRETS